MTEVVESSRSFQFLTCFVLSTGSPYNPFPLYLRGSTHGGFPSSETLNDPQVPFVPQVPRGGRFYSRSRRTYRGGHRTSRASESSSRTYGYSASTTSTPTVTETPFYPYPSSTIDPRSLLSESRHERPLPFLLPPQESFRRLRLKVSCATKILLIFYPNSQFSCLGFKMLFFSFKNRIPSFLLHV